MQAAPTNDYNEREVLEVPVSQLDRDSETHEAPALLFENADWDAIAAIRAQEREIQSLRPNTSPDLPLNNVVNLNERISEKTAEKALASDEPLDSNQISEEQDAQVRRIEALRAVNEAHSRAA